MCEPRTYTLKIFLETFAARLQHGTWRRHKKDVPGATVEDITARRTEIFPEPLGFGHVPGVVPGQVLIRLLEHVVTC
jgi:hypothetical protein